MTDQAATPRTITVLADFRVLALDALKKLARKANRYGTEPITFTVSPTYNAKRTFKDWDGQTRALEVAVCDIEVSGAAPKVGNYQFIARL